MRPPTRGDRGVVVAFEHPWYGYSGTVADVMVSGLLVIRMDNGQSSIVYPHEWRPASD